jgi:hypothetical protein
MEQSGYGGEEGWGCEREREVRFVNTCGLATPIHLVEHNLHM